MSTNLITPETGQNPPDHARILATASSMMQVHLDREAPVLLVDDDPNIAPLVRAALSPFQVRLDAVASGTEAVAMLQRRRYDLLVLDLGLGDVHGFELLRLLKSQPRFQNTKVLVLTAATSLESLARSFGHGADDFVKKPFDTHELGMRAFRLLSA
jgi:two-component system, cell cycle response regulator CtrA